MRWSKTFLMVAVISITGFDLPAVASQCPCNIAMVPSAADVWRDATCLLFTDKDGAPAVALKSANELNALNVGVTREHGDMIPYCSFVHSARCSFVHSARLDGFQYYQNLSATERAACIEDVAGLLQKSSQPECLLMGEPGD